MILYAIEQRLLGGQRAEHRGRSTRSEWPQTQKRNHPLHCEMETSRVDGVKAPLHNWTPRSHEWFVKRRLGRLQRGRLLPDAVEDGVGLQLAPTVHAEAAGLASKTLMPQSHHHSLTHGTPLRRVVGLQSEEVLVAHVLVQHQGGRPCYV